MEDSYKTRFREKRARLKLFHKNQKQAEATRKLKDARFVAPHCWIGRFNT
jgi:hypothetical protein